MERRQSRRGVLRLGLAGLSAALLGTLTEQVTAPVRGTLAAPARLPNIQFDLADYLAPVELVYGVPCRFPPVYTLFITARLSRTPSKADQRQLAGILDAIEAAYPFRADGLFLHVAYGLPYFARLPGGLNGPLVAQNMPRLLANPSRYALEEAIPGPTDVSPLNPGINKERFNTPVRIEANELLFTLRSDNLNTLTDVLAWMNGVSPFGSPGRVRLSVRGLLSFTSARLMFVQPGLPRRVAAANRLGFAGRVHPESPMWMGFADQQASGAGPAAAVVFQGSLSAQLTTATAASYFADGAVQHLAHTILDLGQFYADDEPYTERVQYMYRSTPMPSAGYADQFADGGGPSYIENLNQGPNDAENGAAGIGTQDGERRIGHLAALQRVSRAADGTPLHIRADGPGFDTLDVPDGSSQPKLQFSIFVPTADFFANMRRRSAALDLAQKYGVTPDDNGLERFLTATRRQNFLVPPRLHRAFPLLELT